MADRPYNIGLSRLGQEWLTGTWKAMLVTSGYSFDKDHDFPNSATADELTDPSYSRITLTGNVIVVNDAGDDVKFDCDDIDFGSITGGEVVAGCILFLFLTNDADSPLLLFFDVPNVATNGTPYIIQINANGVIVASE